MSNPDPTLGALPEQVVVTQGGGAPQIERITASNLVSSGEHVLADSKILDLFEQAKLVTSLWRARVNSALDPLQTTETLTLDFEFKDMAAGWPALKGDLPRADARLVIKQARTLEPGLRGVPEAVLDLPIPRDVLARALLVERLVCDMDGSTVTWVEVSTDPLQVPDVGFSEAPLVVDADPLWETMNPDDCERSILYSTPQQFLVELLARGELLNLSP